MSELFESEEIVEPVDGEPQVSEPTEDEIATQEFEHGLNESLGVRTEEAPARVEPAQQLIAGMTEAELKTALEKANRFDELEERISKLSDKAFGTIGGLKKSLEDIKNRPVSSSPKISKETFKRFSEYFGDEEIGAALADDFAAIEFDSPAAQPLEFPTEEVDKRLNELQQRFEVKLLTAMHPDWRELVKSEEYANWTKTLKPEAQELLSNSWDGEVLADAFSKFKGWRNRKADAVKTKQERLEAAIPVTGDTRPVEHLTDDAFNQGLKSVVSRRLR